MAVYRFKPQITQILKKNGTDFTTKHTKEAQSSLRKESLCALCLLCASFVPFVVSLKSESVAFSNNFREFRG